METNKRKYKFNAHGHLLPYPEDIPSFMKDEKIFWVDKKRKFMRQKGWRRPIDDPSFFLNEKLEWMDQHGIDHEVILNLSQLYCNGLSKKVAKKVIRFQNDFNASAQAKHPKKITAGFVVQPAYLKDALKEMKRCVEELGMMVLCLPTHFLNKKGQWKSTASEEVAPIFELANEYNLAIQIHPYDAPKMIALENVRWRFHLVWMMAQTADTYHHYTLLDFPDRFPSIRTSFAHANQFAQVNIGRRLQGFKGRPDLFEGTVNPMKHVRHRNIYFDTLTHDDLTFELLVKRQGTRQIIAGLDNPYPLGEMDTVEDCYPGKVLDHAVLHGVIGKTEKDEIWFDNVIHWIAGHKKSKFLLKIGKM